MKIEKTFTMTQDEYHDENGNKNFVSRIADYLSEKYNCRKDIAIINIHQAMAYGWSLCSRENEQGVVGIQTNLYRDQIYIGQ